MRVLITGAKRGIGRALFDACAARGDEVHGTAREAASGDPDGWHPVDVTRPDTLRMLGESWGAKPLDLLVCNAGIYIDQGESIDTGYPSDAWAETFAVNVTGVFLTVQALLPGLRAARGRIAILSSAMGSDARAPGGSYIYRASKAAVLNLGRNLATDLRAEGIAVGIYHPGWVMTDMGGSGANVPPAVSARDLLARFDALSLATSGCFENHDGQPIPF
ncbi:SDR family NAD(P)-dependent oxidoreductase [Albidovulum sediminis]|uniref:SDR family NAD(P)-dependent oxidoreductase n=1 Tax=Albidovulum sediminis TaxID=3066345 RepID=A0ABT2NPF5_9RHOB|nr:SDR family NAD(P)-dependent oxidoreductase [Defluviimonas sediminis]MCT8329834.1 SDR family NAD(P)-dependent oxidoreductase [Defluviimonas sediminis]